MESHILVPFIAAFFSGTSGSEVGHWLKNVERARLVQTALGILIGFMAAIVTLLLMSRDLAHPLLIAISFGFLFGYLMSDAKTFVDLK